MLTRLAIALSVLVSVCGSSIAQEKPKKSAEANPSQRISTATPGLSPADREYQEKMMKEIFPVAPPKATSIKCFQALPKKVSMYMVVGKCGRPDGDFGSGFMIFVYSLKDGSHVFANCVSSPNKVYKLGYTDRHAKQYTLIDEWDPPALSQTK